jgi:hypothetical protein
MKQLTERENDYLRLMQAMYLVPFLKGRPGNAKTATINSIAKKMGYVLIDKRLATMDETELGVYPIPVDSENGKYKVISSAVPEWAENTKDESKNFIIVFEELNRASKAVRDAALGVLLERRIGENFVFGPNVLMCATGNLGTEDGTEVEELDSALKSRLITIEHKVELAEWLKDYAEDLNEEGNPNVHRDIARYLKENASDYYPEIKDQEKDAGGLIVLNPRTWDGFSKFIITHYGHNSTYEQYGREIERVGKYYIGHRIARFCKWMGDNSRLSFKEVLSGKVKDYSKFNRENLNEVLGELKAHKVCELTLPQFNKGVKHFLLALEDDIRYGALWDLTTEVPFGDKDPKLPVVQEFINTFATEIKSVREKKTTNAPEATN